MDYYHKYQKYKNKYIQLKGGSEITLTNLKDKGFINYLKKNIKPFLNEKRQHGGIMTLNRGSYEFTESLDIHDETGTVLFKGEYLQTIKPNQIVWRTYIDHGQKCSPPSSLDIYVVMDMAYNNVFNYGVVVAQEGVWIYKLKDTVVEKMKKNAEDYVMAVADMINVLDGIYCHPDTDFLKKVDPKGELGIKKIGSNDEYMKYIREFFKGDIEVDFAKF